MQIAPSVSETATAIEYATVGRRVLAQLLDGILLSGLNIVAGYMVGRVGWDLSLLGRNTRSRTYAVLILVSLAIYLSYNISMTFRYQATLGKLALGIKVIDRSINSVAPRAVVIRESGKAAILFALAVLPFGFLFAIAGLWATWDRRRQTLYDKLAETYVVRA